MIAFLIGRLALVIADFAIGGLLLLVIKKVGNFCKSSLELT